MSELVGQHKFVIIVGVLRENQQLAACFAPGIKKA